MFISYILSDVVSRCNKNQVLIIPKITSTYLCKPIHDIINYSTSVCLFESEKFGKEGEILQNVEYLESKKSFLDGKKTFFIVFEGLSFSDKIKI